MKVIESRKRVIFDVFVRELCLVNIIIIIVDMISLSLSAYHVDIPPRYPDVLGTLWTTVVVVGRRRRTRATRPWRYDTILLWSRRV